MACSSCENGGADPTGLGGEGFDLGLSLPTAYGMLDNGSIAAGIFGKKKKKKDDDDTIPTCAGILFYGDYDAAYNWVLDNCGGDGWVSPINMRAFPQEWCVGCGDMPSPSVENPATIEESS